MVNAIFFTSWKSKKYKNRFKSNLKTLQQKNPHIKTIGVHTGAYQGVFIWDN